MELAKAHEIQAAVVLHPGPITVDDIKVNLLSLYFWRRSNTFYNSIANDSEPNYSTCYLTSEVKCSFSILGAEIDHVSPPELIKQFEQVLSANSGVSSHFSAA